VAEPCRDQGDWYALQVHQCGAGVPCIVKAHLRHVEVVDGRLPQLAQCRRGVGLAGLVADDVAEICLGFAKGELFGGLAGFRCSEFRQQGIGYRENATGGYGLGLVLVQGAAPDIDSRRADSQSPLLEVNVLPSAGRRSRRAAGQPVRGATRADCGHPRCHLTQSVPDLG
jgi:hypothetical protein